MRTLGLLLALLFLAAQTPAQLMGEEAEEATGRPEATEAQEAAAALMAARAADRHVTDPEQQRIITCSCRTFCFLGERISGRCYQSVFIYRLCCRG
ncbi:defensin-A3 isoform X2 [Ornithorhynchus anatinus]|uniref:Defensin-A3 n=1 Tax=Ornithorhynchus anatinus TaxID=9258 RepID=DEFA3_ORNAN|nr:defensin-A3 isoform X2 [Ornithorhynchus anatinus]P0C8A3.1 RecName: Full=Defensin-A3; Short=DefA3; Short=OaDefA3; Flags: Precursor [Ornithorhynchus anatinus]